MMNNKVTLLGVAGMIIFWLGLLVPIACPPDGCPSINETALISMVRYQDADNFGDGIAASMQGINLFIVLMLAAYFFLNQPENAFALWFITIVLLLSVMVVFNYYNERISGDNSIEMAWAWLLLFGGIVLMFVAAWTAGLSVLPEEPSDVVA